MFQIINDIIKGFLILAFGSGTYGMSQDIVTKATEAHKIGLMSYSKYTKILTAIRD